MPRLPRVQRRHVLATGGAALALPFVARPAHAAVTWTLFSQQLNPSTAIVRGMRRMSDLVRDRTNGALLLIIRTAGTLPIDANDVMAAVTSGKVEMGDDLNYNASFPLAAMLRLPLLVTSPEEFDKVSAIAQPVLEAEMLKRGVVLLGHYRTAMQCFWSRQRAASFADIARQRLRVSSMEQAEFVRQYLGLHLITSTTEMGEALLAGKADGALTTAFQGGRLWKQFLKHVHLAGPNYLDGVIVAGRGPLDQLPPDLRGVLTETARETATWIGRTQDMEEQQIIRQLVTEGLKVTPGDPAEIAQGIQKIAPYWDAWVRLRGNAMEPLLAEIRQALDR